MERNVLQLSTINIVLPVQPEKTAIQNTIVRNQLSYQKMYRVMLLSNKLGRTEYMKSQPSFY